MSETATLHDAHAALGARFALVAGAEVPRSYGAPAGEYDSIRHGAALVDRADLVLLRVHGRDPVKMIQGLATNDVAALAPGGVAYTAFLTPKGRMIADARALRIGAEVWLVVSRLALDGLTAHLRKFVPPLFARFDVDPRAMLGVYGPGAPAALERAGTSAPPAAGASVEAGIGGASVVAYADPAAIGSDVALLVQPGDARAVWSALRDAGATPAGHAALDVARIEDGRPAWGAELTEEVIPLEAGLRTVAISETKGCYTGQEVIVRILHRGHVNRQLRGLSFGEAAAPARGTSLVRASDGKVIGQVTSAAQSPRHDAAIGLGYVRREVDPPAAVRLERADGSVVRVVALPFAGGSIRADAGIEPERRTDAHGR